MCKIITFNFNNLEVRTATKDKDILFCLVDVAKCLDIANNKNILKRLDGDGVHPVYLTDTLGRQQEANFINEPNLYRVIFRSDKPEAVKFQDWVFNEVLPALRKDGKYEIGQKQNQDIATNINNNNLPSCPHHNNYIETDNIPPELKNLEIVKTDLNYNKERPCYWCPVICNCEYCTTPTHIQATKKTYLYIQTIFEKMIRSEIDKDYKQHNLINKVLYDLIKTNRDIDWDNCINSFFLDKICELAFIGYKTKYNYKDGDTENTQKRLCFV
jgi:prophage antirepressor-like protein